MDTTWWKTFVCLLLGIITLKLTDVQGNRKHRVKRDTVGYTYRRWPHAHVPYVISVNASAVTRHAFKSAMKAIQKHSCVQFVHRRAQRDYVEVITGVGCYSMIGRQGGKQTLSLGLGCHTTGIAIHEVMHLVGFHHEHTRLDRDNHIFINYYNIHPNAKKQFQKYKYWEGDTLGAEYDPYSIMHYANDDFSKNGEFTITYKEDPKKLLGQRKSLSKIDILQLNKLYKCDHRRKRKHKKRVCQDNARMRHNKQCSVHLLMGSCFSNRSRMRVLCPRTCGLCRTAGCVDTANHCSLFSFFGFCRTMDVVKQRCRKTCRVCI